MSKFSELSIGILVVMCLIVLIEAYIIYNYIEKEADILHQLDLNGDGVVSRSELKYILNHHTKKKSTPSIDRLIQSARTGALRGGLMGLISHGIEGAVAGGLVLAVINPMVSGIEHML